MTTRADVVQTARTWENVPFRHQGRTRNGVDCVGLLVVVARTLGLSNYDFTNYDRRPGGDFLSHFQDNCREVVPITRARPGDIIVFNQAIYPCHVGILTEYHGQPGVIHSLVTYRRVREMAYEGQWEAEARFAFEFPGLED